jgi:hypothetical protein
MRDGTVELDGAETLVTALPLAHEVLAHEVLMQETEPRTLEHSHDPRGVLEPTVEISHDVADVRETHSHETCPTQPPGPCVLASRRPRSPQAGAGASLGASE